MQSILLRAIAFAAIAVPAFADGLPMPPPGGVIVSPDGITVISSDLCAKLPPGAASAVPSADYKPGVDVAGNPVAPADLPGSAPNIPIAIKLDLRSHLGTSAPRGGAVFAFLTVRDGHAYFNGEEITDPERDAIVAGCKAAHR